MTEIEALCERLEGIATTDHERGCEGRNYACSCGWDEENMEIGRQASATILDLIASARRDAELLSRVHQMATEGHVKPGCDNWRAVERCRQIANLTARAAHTGEG
ncbi:hypothetical protein [Brevundimonas sp.]|uniref:hypothetical protein n=1 Tax=Brevundimonas sp. TaxID=1871086 RepID=UPI0035AE41F9